MSALEFAIGQTLRNYVFSLRLLLAWAVILFPLTAAVFFLALDGKMPDPARVPPMGLAGGALVAAVAVLAMLSLAVNWYRRILLGETPNGLQWWRLDRPVWRYLAANLLVLAILAVFGLAGAAALIVLKPRLESAWGPAAGQGALGLAVVLALLGLIAGFRLAAWPPAAAVGASGFGLIRVRRVTIGNAIRYLSLLFWLLFTLGMASGAAAGGLLAAQAYSNPWLAGSAVFLAIIIAWFGALLLLSVPASLYRHFGERKTFGDP